MIFYIAHIVGLGSDGCVIQDVQISGNKLRELDRENLLGTVRKGYETQNEQAPNM